MSNHLRDTVYLVWKSAFYFYQEFAAGLRKTIKVAVNINLAAAILFLDKTRLLDQLR